MSKQFLVIIRYRFRSIIDLIGIVIWGHSWISCWNPGFFEYSDFPGIWLEEDQKFARLIQETECRNTPELVTFTYFPLQQNAVYFHRILDWILPRFKLQSEFSAGYLWHACTNHQVLRLICPISDGPITNVRCSRMLLRWSSNYNHGNDNKHLTLKLQYQPVHRTIIANACKHQRIRTRVRLAIAWIAPVKCFLVLNETEQSPPSRLSTIRRLITSVFVIVNQWRSKNVEFCPNRSDWFLLPVTRYCNYCTVYEQLVRVDGRSYFEAEFDCHSNVMVDWW